jgi:hypothetical protein
MTPDEVVKELEILNQLTNIEWYGKEREAIRSAISLLQDYQKLRERVRISPIKLAVIFHEIYERLAPKIGYETKKETKVFDASSPNGKLMIEVCREMQTYLQQQTEH